MIIYIIECKIFFLFSFFSKKNSRSISLHFIVLERWVYLIILAGKLSFYGQYKTNTPGLVSLFIIVLCSLATNLHCISGYELKLDWGQIGVDGNKCLTGLVSLKLGSKG